MQAEYWCHFLTSLIFRPGYTIATIFIRWSIADLQGGEDNPFEVRSDLYSVVNTADESGPHIVRPSTTTTSPGSSNLAAYLSSYEPLLVKAPNFKDPVCRRLAA